MRMKGNPQRLSIPAVETVRSDGVVMSLTTAGSEQHDGCVMSNRNNRRLILALAGLATGVLAVSNVVCAQMPCQYEVTAIIQPPECPPFGIPPTIGRGISEPIDGGLPNVVGYYLSCAIGPNTAFVWIGNENRFTTLDFQISTSQSQANGISDDGTRIVGTADVVGEGTRGFLFDGEVLTIIPPANDGTFSDAQTVNTDQVTGTTSISNRPPFHHNAFVWQDEVMTLIEPTFGPRSSAADIDAAGAAVGWMGAAVGIDSHAFLFENGRVSDLGLAPGTFATWAKGVNNLGEVLVRGEFEEKDPTDRINGSFLLRDGKFIDLGQLPGYDVIAGIDLNDRSQIVGLQRAVQSSNEPDIGFIWQDRVIRNLNDLIPPESGLWIKRAEAINQAGQITGRGTDAMFDIVAFVLSPVEPALGDLNGDCEVGVRDLLILLASWGPCDDCDNCLADLDDNCIVGVSDLLILLGNWG